MTTEDISLRLRRDIEEHYRQLHGPVSINFSILQPEGIEMARVDFKVVDFGKNHVIEHRHGIAGYINGNLSLNNTIKVA